jgi:hypothetical protein
MSDLFRDQELPRLIPVDLEHISQLQYSCFQWTIPKRRVLAGLIRFEGIYQSGSLGADDALFIKWRVNEFCEYPNPGRIYGLIVDFRSLQYEWGDDLDIPAERLRVGDWPIRIVVTPERANSFRSWLGDEVRVDLRTAFEEIRRIIEDRWR